MVRAFVGDSTITNEPPALVALLAPFFLAALFLVAFFLVAFFLVGCLAVVFLALDFFAARFLVAVLRGAPAADVEESAPVPEGSVSGGSFECVIRLACSSQVKDESTVRPQENVVGG
jgi:hypothetical protein